MSELTTIGYKINSKEELKEQVPAAFSTMPHPERTERYSLFSTEQFLDAFAKLGWYLHSGKQHGANQFSRHLIRFNNDDMATIPVKGDQIKPQLILDNSHDGYTPAQIHLGLLRTIGQNGLVAKIPGLSNTVKFRHVGVNQTEMMEVIAETAEQYRKIANHVTDLQAVSLTEDQKKEFAYRALAIRDPHRFVTGEGTPDFDAINSALEIEDIYEPIRPQDESDDLWTVFNVVQERTIKGLYEAKSKSGRKANPKPITNAARHLKYNQDLWELAEEFKTTYGDSNYKTYISVKGVSSLVQVMANLDNGKSQVKDVKANRVFVVSTERLLDEVKA